MVAKKGLHPALEKMDKGLAQRIYLVQFWFIGPPQLPDHLPFCVMSQQAILDMMGHAEITTGKSEDEVLKKYIQRLGLRHAVPRLRLVQRINLDPCQHRLVPVYRRTLPI